MATQAVAAMAVVAIGALDARRKREVGAERQREEAATRAVEWMAAMAVTEARATRRRGRGRRQRLQCPPVPRGPRRPFENGHFLVLPSWCCARPVFWRGVALARAA